MPIRGRSTYLPVGLLLALAYDLGLVIQTRLQNHPPPRVLELGSYLVYVCIGYWAYREVAGYTSAMLAAVALITTIVGLLAKATLGILAEMTPALFLLRPVLAVFCGLIGVMIGRSMHTLRHRSPN
jgi:hypothetical protein